MHCSIAFYSDQLVGGGGQFVWDGNSERLGVVLVIFDQVIELDLSHKFD